MKNSNHDENKDRLAEQYDLFANKFKALYLAEKERGAEAVSTALEKAREQLTTLGELSEEQGEVLKTYLDRDLEQTISDAKWLGEEAKEKLNPARLGAGALSSLASVLELTNNAIHSLLNKTVLALTYKTGEITSAGSLTCQACGQKKHLKKTGHVPPCPKCDGTLFYKGY
ncbi:MAG: hypothetical protein Q8J59_01505 [Methylotenera sp.]|nr:hypothetical protein [Methylotenera sp.]MDO9388039.1 hypothetical protein [Methylotenera sp.]MDP2101046.1 hypothetical protein [Methylotenera sp.]MDP2280346.1 hypothetical protein [Methylotenera sp.]MDP3060835.1 hypothetical protein [Methylotenera sp.]